MCIFYFIAGFWLISEETVFSFTISLLKLLPSLSEHKTDALISQLLHCIVRNCCCCLLGGGVVTTPLISQNLENATSMFHDASDEEWVVSAAVVCLYQGILIPLQRLWFSLFVCPWTCLWANRPLLVVLYLFNTIVVWTEGIINRLTKHTILLLGWENLV